MVQLLGTATEQISFELGDTLSGLLNASFGNAVEIIVGIAALLQSKQAAVILGVNALIWLADELRIVQTSVSKSICALEYTPLRWNLATRVYLVQLAPSSRLFILCRYVS